MAPPVKHWRIFLSFTAHMTLLIVTSSQITEKILQSSHGCYIYRLCTILTHTTDSEWLNTLPDYNIYTANDVNEAHSRAECYSARKDRTSSTQLTTRSFEKIPLTTFFVHINPTKQDNISNMSHRFGSTVKMFLILSNCYIFTSSYSSSCHHSCST